LLFALSNHFSHMGLERSDARSGTLISIATSAAVYWLFAPFFLEGWYWLTTAALIFALVGVIRPALSTMLATSSIKMMGPTLTSSLTAVTPIFGAIFAILILGEHMSLPIAVGTAAVVAGAVVAAWNPKGLKRTWPLWAIALPLGASLVRAAGHIGTKYGLIELDSPSFAVLVGNTVSLGSAVLCSHKDCPARIGGVAEIWVLRCGHRQRPVAAISQQRTCRRRRGGGRPHRLGDPGVHDVAGRIRLWTRDYYLAHDRDDRVDRAGRGPGGVARRALNVGPCGAAYARNNARAAEARVVGASQRVAAPAASSSSRLP
jgi:uncharacterized membrane protein